MKRDRRKLVKDYTNEANEYAKEIGLDEPDWFRKLVVKIYLAAAKRAWEDAEKEFKGDIND